MIKRYSQLDVVVNEHDIQIWLGPHEYFQFAVTVIDGTRRLIATAKRYDDTVWVDRLPLDVDSLDVQITSKEQTELMALPHARRRAASTELIKSSRSTRQASTSSSDERVAEHTRDRILDAILDALIDNPNLTRAEVSAINHKIANRFKENNMVVAGIAANLTRGTYGDKSRLIAQRRRERLRKARG